MATNLVRDDARKQERQRKHLQLLANEERERIVEETPVDVERAHERALARQAIEQLDERDRNALLMREEGLNYPEIAEALGLSVGSIGTTLSRARRRLAETYEQLVAKSEGRSGGSHVAS